VPTYTPAASPCLRRRLSAWPPHQTRDPASELNVTRTSDGHALHLDPYPSGLSRVRQLQGFGQWFLAYTYSSLLAGPGPSDSADPSRTLSGLLSPLRAFPHFGCPQLHRPTATDRR
jgi:hypothetical protein